RIAAEVLRARAARRGSVVRVQEPATPQRETAAADAGREPPPNRLKRRDALVELAPPACREPLPIALGRLPVDGQRVEGVPGAVARNARRLPGLDQRDAAKRHDRVAALVAVRTARADQASALVEPQR